MSSNSFSSMMDPSTGNPVGQLMYVSDLLPNKIFSLNQSSPSGRNITCHIMDRILTVKHSSLSVTATTLCENSRNAWSLELKTNKGLTLIKLDNVKPTSVIDEIICLLMTRLSTEEVDALISTGKFKQKFYPLFIDNSSLGYTTPIQDHYYLANELVWIDRYLPGRIWSC